MIILWRWSINFLEQSKAFVSWVIGEIWHWAFQRKLQLGFWRWSLTWRNSTKWTNKGSWNDGTAPTKIRASKKIWMAHFLKDLRFAQLQLMLLLFGVVGRWGYRLGDDISLLNNFINLDVFMIEQWKHVFTLNHVFTITTKFNFVFGSTGIGLPLSYNHISSDSRDSDLI